MDYSKFIKPRDLEVGGKTYAISQIPAIESQEIYREVAKCVKEFGPLGMTMLPSGALRAILSYVAARVNDSWFPLDTESRIDSYITDKADMNRIVVAMIKENWSFLTDGNLLDVLGLGEAEESE